MNTATQNNSATENTYIHISKFRVYIRILLGIILIAAAIFLYFNSLTNPNTDLGKGKIVLYIGPIAALFLFYQAFTALQKKGPQITLSDKGITVAEKELMLWEDVTEIKITSGSSKILSFKYLNERIKVNFETYTIKPFELKELIDTYRSRHLQNAHSNMIS